MPILAFTQPMFQPAMRIIATIVKGPITTVTTTFAHNYLDQEIVRIVVPNGFGMYQINKQYAPVTIIDATTFTMPIDSTTYDAFVIPPTNPIGLTPGPINVPGTATQLQIGQIFIVGFTTFTIYQLGAGVATYTTVPAETATIDTTVNPNTVTFVGTVAGSPIFYHPGAPGHYYTPAQTISMGSGATTDNPTQLRIATKNVLPRGVR
jgi:hypothetical protein